MEPRFQEIPERAIRIQVPDVRQRTDWSCGASALQAVAGYFGVGPAEEAEFARDIGIDPRIGAHPDSIEQAARGYGLQVLQQAEMSYEALRSLLDQGRPVLLMIQAWGNPQIYTDDEQYVGVWKEGHWVVAIGYDDTGFFFEDPALAAVRGYLTCDGLTKRWRDTGPHGRHLFRVGVAIWKEGAAPAAYLSRAIYIG